MLRNANKCQPFAQTVALHPALSLSPLPPTISLHSPTATAKLPPVLAHPIPSQRPHLLMTGEVGSKERAPTLETASAAAPRARAASPLGHFRARSAQSIAPSIMGVVLPRAAARWRGPET